MIDFSILVAEIIYNEATSEWERRQMLRSPDIDYCNGRFFVTVQAFHNKSVFGAIVGEKCVLNELGTAVKAAWQSEPEHVAGLKLGEFVVMPNHFHAIVECHAPAWRSGPADTSGDRPTVGGRSPVISTFTSHYERQVLEKCLASERDFIWGCPGGCTETILAKTEQVRAEGRALLISPVDRDTGINKQRANWCNQFIVQNAAEIWVGHIRPISSLETILRSPPTCLSS